MTINNFIDKWSPWLPYTEREEKIKEMETDLKALILTELNVLSKNDDEGYSKPIKAIDNSKLKAFVDDCVDSGGIPDNDYFISDKDIDKINNIILTYIKSHARLMITSIMQKYI